MLEEEIIVIEPDDEEEIVVLEEAIEKIYPQLENLEVNPSAEKQVFNHKGSYGYDEVVVNAITGDTLEITPSKEEQTFNGVYTEVKSKGVTSEVDENIKAENIKGGVEILGVEGTLEAIDYWSTEPSSYPTYSFKFNYYMKEIPPFLDFSNLKSMYNLFELSLIEEADLSKYKIGEVTSLYGLFSNCVNLKRVILRGHKFNSVTTIGSMFSSCTNLEYIDMRDFEYHDGINVYSTFKNVPTNCLIIVKDEAMRNLLLTSSKYLTNIKTVAELGE
jgi:hypothetical protein